MKIYTKTGDKGETGLWGGARVPKSHPRVAAYGDVDELNSCLGCAAAALKPEHSRRVLATIQEELFVVGALLAAPEGKAGDWAVPPDAVSRLERAIDEMTGELRPMTKFIFPGGSAAGAWLHLARTICRRAERSVVELSSKEMVSQDIIIYLNRLADYLFTAARWVNSQEGRAETEWAGLAKKP